MHLPDKPAEISREVGGAFSLFGGYIMGRHVEQGAGSKIVFDHTGFPKGEAEVLASGWKAHYWEPLAKLLA